LNTKPGTPACASTLLLLGGLLLIAVGCAGEKFDFYPIEGKVLVRLADDPQAGPQSDVLLLVARTREWYDDTCWFLDTRSRMQGSVSEIEFRSTGHPRDATCGDALTQAFAQIRLGPFNEGEYNLIFSLRDSLYTGTLTVLSDVWQVTWPDSSAVVFENTSLTRINP
jgi:hypothetical protein